MLNNRGNAYRKGQATKAEGSTPTPLQFVITIDFFLFHFLRVKNKYLLGLELFLLGRWRGIESCWRIQSGSSFGQGTIDNLFVVFECMGHHGRENRLSFHGRLLYPRFSLSVGHHRETLCQSLFSSCLFDRRRERQWAQTKTWGGRCKVIRMIFDEGTL